MLRYLLSKLVIFVLLSMVTVSGLAAQSMEEEARSRCIVQLKDSFESDKVRGLAQALAVKANASIKYVYTNSINGFTITVPCFVAETVFGDHEAIESLEPDSIMKIVKRPTNPGKPDRGEEEPDEPVVDNQTVSYGTTRVGGPVDGSGKTAWVIDTGIDTDHLDLNVDKSKGFTVFRTMEDDHGHGTHVAGIIGAIDNTIGSLGVAPNTTVVPVRVLDRRGSGSTSGVIAGVDYVAANASVGDCVNMSLGGGVSTTLDNAVVNAAENSGAYFTLAAGNESDDANNHSPARANGTGVYTISAMDSNDAFAWFSNYGNPPIDYAAPGVEIFSLWKKNGTDTKSGTSMAAPHACAVLMMNSGEPATDGTILNDPDPTDDPIIHLK